MTTQVMLDDTARPFWQIDPTTGQPLPPGTSVAPIYSKDAYVAGKGDFKPSISAATTLAAAAGGSIPAGAIFAYIQPDGGDIYLSRDGGTASASHGLHLYDGTMFPVYSDLANVSICPTAGSVLVNIQFRS